MNDKPKLILVLVEDLYFTSRIESTAKNLGFQVELLERANGIDRGFVEVLKERQPSLVIFDLNNKHIPWKEWILEAKEDETTSAYPLIAFGSHMDVETMQMAKASGADAVLAKSRFTEAMAELILKYGRGRLG